MANVLQFGILRSGVLKRVNEVFPERESQWRELSRISKENQQSGHTGPPSIDEAKLLVRMLEILISLQRQTSPPSSVDEVKGVMEKMSFILNFSTSLSLSDPVRELMKSICSQISGYCAVFLVFILHMFIYNHTSTLAETIEYWTARKPDRFRFWYLFEKTPLFWARYYQLIQVPHQLIHPELEVAIRVAWLKRMRVALHYFLGRSQYNFAQLPLENMIDVDNLTETLLLDVDNLNAALADSFSLPGLKFEISDSGLLKAMEIDSNIDTTTEKMDNDVKDDNEINSNISSHSHSPPSHPLPPNSDNFQHQTEGQTHNDPEPSNMSKSTSSTTSKQLSRTTTSSNLLRSVRKDHTHGQTHHFHRDQQHQDGLKTPSLSPRLVHSSSLSASPSSSSITSISTHDVPQSLRTSQSMKKSTSSRHLTDHHHTDSPPLSNSASSTIEFDTSNQQQQLYQSNPTQIQAIIIENLDANMLISPPQVDELVASYRARERQTQANLSISGQNRKIKQNTPVASPSNFQSSLVTQEPVISEHQLDDSYSTDGLPKEEKQSPQEVHSSGIKHVHFNQPSSSNETSGLLLQSEFVPKTDSLKLEPESFLNEARFFGSCSSVAQCMQVSLMKVKDNAIPPFYKRNWMICSVVGVMVGVGAIRLFRNWTPVTYKLIEAKNAMYRFMQEHAIIPIISIYKTIRYDSSDVEVMSKNSLDEDVASLVRMVEDFNREKDKSLTIKELDSIAIETRSGTIPSVMKAYESEISHPIANALAGDLLRLALIQVQKQKVDIEKAMAQLDRLLKQNEINFQLMALLPVALVTTGLISLWFNSTRDPYKKQHTAIRTLLRRVAIHINRSSLEISSPSTAATSTLTSLIPPSSSSSSTSNVLDSLSQLRHHLPPLLLNQTQPNGDHHHPEHHRLSSSSQTIDLDSTSMHNEDFGLLLCLISQLFSLSLTLPVQERIGFIEDLSDLAKVHFSSRQRLATIQRMYNNYRFLGETP